MFHLTRLHAFCAPCICSLFGDRWRRRRHTFDALWMRASPKNITIVQNVWFSVFVLWLMKCDGAPCAEYRSVFNLMNICGIKWFLVAFDKIDIVKWVKCVHGHAIVSYRMYIIIYLEIKSLHWQIYWYVSSVAFNNILVYAHVLLTSWANASF